jgi:Flp pilus assembly protein TadG
MTQGSVMRRKGQSMIELGAGLLILIPIVLAIFDLAVLVIAVQVNDNACREAARIAASGDPASASIRAASVIARANSTSSGMVSNFRMVGVDLLPVDVATQVTALQPYGGTITGTVTVTTDVDVKPFIVQWVYSGGRPLTFRSRQSFPFTYVVPNTATPN